MRKINPSKVKLLYEQGLNDCQIARKLGIKRGIVRYQRVKMGLPALVSKGNRTMPSELKRLDDKLVKLYNKGYTYIRIAKECGCHRQTVSRRLKNLGFKPKYLGTIQPRIPLTAKLAKRVRELYCDNIYTLKEISKQLGVSLTTLYKWTKKLKLPPRRQFERIDRIRFSELCYKLRNGGLTDSEIAQKLDSSISHVGEAIGFAIMRRCRVETTCPYKALLPESDVAEKKI